MSASTTPRFPSRSQPTLPQPTLQFTYSCSIDPPPVALTNMTATPSTLCSCLFALGMRSAHLLNAEVADYPAPLTSGLLPCMLPPPPAHPQMSTSAPTHRGEAGVVQRLAPRVSKTWIALLLLGIALPLILCEQDNAPHQAGNQIFFLLPPMAACLLEHVCHAQMWTVGCI